MNLLNQCCLDNPTWHALTSRQSDLAQGSSLALRYRPDVAPFAAVKNTTQAAFDELMTLIPDGAYALMQTLAPLPPMNGVHTDRLFSFYQMVDVGEVGEVGDVDDARENGVVRLSASDVSDMVGLAERTQPGPFSKRTIATGRYFGVRDGEHLIAMAGERMRMDGYVEISAVCVDERYRGKGLARHLMNALRREIRARGDVPFLHVRDDNTSAMALYEQLGFETRQTFLLNRVTRPQLY